MSNRFLGIAALFVFFVLLCVSAEAAVYYVNNQDANAADANPGSIDAPWRTIQHAADVVNPGDTVIVKPGVYNESVKVSRGGTSTAPVVFKGEPGAVMDGTGLTNDNDWTTWYNGNGFVNVAWNQQNGWWDFAPVDYVQIEGFEIRNYRIGIFIEELWDDVTSQYYGANGWVIKNNIIHDNTDQGIEIWGGSAPESANAITGNYLYNNYWADIHNHHYSVVEGNIALSHATGQNIRSCGALSYSGESQKVMNNTVMNGRYGILVELANSEYKNNIIMNNQRYVYTDEYGQTYEEGGYAFHFRPRDFSDISLVTISYNDVYNNYAAVGNYKSTLFSAISDLPPTAAVGNISADPLFVNNTGDHTGDYHLTASSPCIDAGDPADAVPAGGGSRIDIGAYEFTKATPTVCGLAGQVNASNIGDHGIKNSLDAKAANACKLYNNKGKEAPARNILEAFIQEVAAQNGKKIDAATADALTSYAQEALNSF